MSNLSKEAKLGLLEAQLLSGKIDRGAFIGQVAAIGISETKAIAKAERYLAIASNHTAFRRNLKCR
jgi:hypothetical protein